MDSKDYKFTGHTSSESDVTRIALPDDLGSYYQYPEGTNFDSMGQLGVKSEADRAIQSECRMCASNQGGTNFDNRKDELHRDCPGQREAPDLVECSYIDEEPGYGSSGEWQHRQWTEEDNTGGDGVPPPEMPEYIVQMADLSRVQVTAKTEAEAVKRAREVSDPPGQKVVTWALAGEPKDWDNIPPAKPRKR